jgi:hypothetical protein
MKFKKLWLFMLFFKMVAIDATDQTNTSETPVVANAATTTPEKKEVVKIDAPQPKPIKIEKVKEIAPLQKTIFTNARVNEIILVITNHKNKQFQIPIKMGHSYTYYYTRPAIKIICHEKLTPKTTLNKADLETYTAFIFNDNQKTDKYHHISIHDKNKALKHARLSGDIGLFNDVCEETIYNL